MCAGSPNVKVKTPKPPKLPPALPPPPAPEAAPPPKQTQSPTAKPDIRIGDAKSKSTREGRRGGASLTIGNSNQGLNL